MFIKTTGVYTLHISSNYVSHPRSPRIALLVKMTDQIQLYFRVLRTYMKFVKWNNFHPSGINYVWCKLYVKYKYHQSNLFCSLKKASTLAIIQEIFSRNRHQINYLFWLFAHMMYFLKHTWALYVKYFIRKRRNCLWIFSEFERLAEWDVNTPVVYVTPESGFVFYLFYLFPQVFWAPTIS